jgi:taurine--2-oxoglutarate transaminase
MTAKDVMQVNAFKWPDKIGAKDLNKEYTFFSWSVQGEVNPIPVTRAEGVYFWDANGKCYIDFSSQLMNTNVGHQHPKVVKAI